MELCLQAMEKKNRADFVNLDKHLMDFSNTTDTIDLHTPDVQLVNQDNIMLQARIHGSRRQELV
jgi:hypothetical protein